MAVDEGNICSVIKWSWTVKWYDFSTAQQALFLCVSFCFRSVNNITSQRKNAKSRGGFVPDQSVVLFLEMFVFEVCQKVAIFFFFCGC